MKKQIIVNCIEDNNFMQNRKIIHSCNTEFKLENIFYVESLGYFDDVIGQYYTICPKCGYIVMIDESIIPEELKKAALISNREDPYQYRKNELRSELIYLEKETPKARVRAMW